MRLKYLHFLILALTASLFIGSGCKMDHRSSDDGGSSSSSTEKDLSAIQYLTSTDIDTRAKLVNDKDEYNLFIVSGDKREYSYYRFTKTGSSSTQQAILYGSNSAILARDGADLSIWNSIIDSSGDNSNAVFAYNTGTIVTVSDCVVLTRGTRAAGLAASNEGTVISKHVTVETSGSDAPPLRAERNGVITAARGRYAAKGLGSPSVYSGGEVTVSNAKLEANAAQSVVINGISSVSLTSCDITADHNTVYDSESAAERLQAVLIRQQGTNAVDGTAVFNMQGGTLTNKHGDIFLVTNTEAQITVSTSLIINEDLSGVLLRAEKSNSGVNGGRVNFYVKNQDIDGDIALDEISAVNVYLSNAAFTGAVNSLGTSGRVYVDATGSVWDLTEDSYVNSLTCDKTSINLNGHTLYIGTDEYVEGTAVKGKPIIFEE